MKTLEKNKKIDDRAISDALDLNGAQVETLADNERKKHERAYERIRSCLGEVFCSVDDDPTVIAIMLNPDTRLWVDKLGAGMSCVGEISAPRSKAAMRVIAGLLNKELTADTPFFDDYIPWNGARLAVQIPPIVENTTFAIRKRAISVFTLAQYVEDGVLSQIHYNKILDLIQGRKNILVVGSTNSGKTPLTNALINEISVLDSESRILIMDDTGEIQCTAKNKVLFKTSGAVHYQELLQTSLRMRPDWIIVGEVRSHVALDILDAWNTGHEGGICTMHANDAEQALLRLESLINRNTYAPKDVKEVIAQAVDAIIFIRKTPEYGRKIEQILLIDGYDRDTGRYRYNVC